MSISIIVFYVMVVHYYNDISHGEVYKFCHPNPPFSSSTLGIFCNEILSWMIEIWMEYHLVSDNNYNIA